MMYEEQWGKSRYPEKMPKLGASGSNDIIGPSRSLGNHDFTLIVLIILSTSFLSITY